MLNIKNNKLLNNAVVCVICFTYETIKTGTQSKNIKHAKSNNTPLSFFLTGQNFKCFISYPPRYKDSLFRFYSTSYQFVLCSSYIYDMSEQHQ